MKEVDSLKSRLDQWKSFAPDLFLADLLHELRTPVMTIKAWSKILSNESTKELHPKASEGIALSVDKLEELCEDIADYYQELANKNLTPELDTFSLP